MKELKTENLVLKFEEELAHMTVTGPVSKDEMGEALDWYNEATEEKETFNLLVDIAKMDFPDLSAISEELKRLGDVWRAIGAINKCAVMTDSTFLRSAAKVEGAVVPGLTVKVFDLTDLGPAMEWLSADNGSKSEAA